MLNLGESLAKIRFGMIFGYITPFSVALLAGILYISEFSAIYFVTITIKIMGATFALALIIKIATWIIGKTFIWFFGNATVVKFPHDLDW